MTKIYSKTGDKGYTSLVGGTRVKKNSIHVEAYGTVDEANSILGIVVSELSRYSMLEDVKNQLLEIQHDLFKIGSELSTPTGEKVYWPITNEYITKLESQIDNLNGNLPELKQFIIPGGSLPGAHLHLARTVIRRAERTSIDIQNINPLVLKYLNRLSDYLFVVARFINHQLNEQEHPFLT